MKIHHFKSTSSYIGRFIGYTLTFLLFMNNDSLLGLFLVFSLKYMPKLYPNIFNIINSFFVVCNFSYFIQISSEQNLKIIETLRQQRAIFKFRSTFCGGWNFTLMTVALLQSSTEQWCSAELRPNVRPNVRFGFGSVLCRTFGCSAELYSPQKQTKDP